MHAKTTGIVLHQLKYSDSSNIVSIYTRQFGRLTFMVRGANSKKSACRAGLFQPLSVLEINFSYQPKRDVHPLKEARSLQPFVGIPYHPVRSSLAIFLAEVLHKTLKHTEPDEYLYCFLEKSVFELDKCEEGLANFHLCFLVQLSEYLGFYPSSENVDSARFFDLQNGVFEYFQPNHPYFLQKENTEAFKVLTKMNFGTLNTLPLSKPCRAELLSAMMDYYKLHIADFQTIKSVEVLHDIFSPLNPPQGGL